MHDSELTITQALPTEILSRIFVLCVQESPPVRFPMRKEVGIPIQITISHVCSTWRQVALNTRELWIKFGIGYPFDDSESYKIWISRAGNRPVTLILGLSPPDTMESEPDVVNTFWTVIKSLRVTRLRLEINVDHLFQLSESAGNKLQNLEQLDLILIATEDTAASLCLPDFVVHTRSVSLFAGDLHVGPLAQNLALPWTHLTCLNLFSGVALSCCITLLRLAPSVEHCSLNLDLVDVESEGQQLTLPRMRSLDLSESEVNSVVSHFIFPNLVELVISSSSVWSTEIYETIKSQYNLHRLRYLHVFFYHVQNPLPSSTLLQDAPMLRHLGMGYTIFLDDDTLNGVAIGDLGRSLSSLALSCKADKVNVILNMVEKRWKTVTQRFERGYSWREELPSLRQVLISDSTQEGTIKDGYKARLSELQHLGIDVKVW